MPRDSNGVYSLPPGNPVVTLTPISSVWANSTLDDIGLALTGSLARDGSGGMTGQLKLGNGTIGAPALSWTTEPTSGLYRAGAGDFRYSISSNDVAQFLAGAFRTVSGVVGTPGISFISDPDTGIYNGAANEINFAVGGALRFSVASGSILSGTVHRFQDGAAATPSITFDADTNTGLFRNGADVLELVTNGIGQLQITTAQVHPRLPVQVLDGSAGAPTYSFVLDGNTGIYRSGTDQIGLSCGGAATAILSTGGIFNLAGSASGPSYSFQGNGNCGIYAVGTNDLGFSTAGVLRANINSIGTFLYEGKEIGFRGAEPRSQASPTVIGADNGKTINVSSGNCTVGIQNAGMLVTIFNASGGNITLVRAGGINLITNGTTTDSDKTVPANGIVTIYYFSATYAVASGAIV